MERNEYYENVYIDKEISKPKKSANLTKKQEIHSEEMPKISES